MSAPGPRPLLVLPLSMGFLFPWSLRLSHPHARKVIWEYAASGERVFLRSGVAYWQQTGVRK